MGGGEASPQKVFVVVDVKVHGSLRCWYGIVHNSVRKFQSSIFAQDSL